jgi:large subunit ribosomal protein L13
MSTFMANRNDANPDAQTVTPQWFVIDATDQIVGRLAVRIANLLRGKHKPQFTPHCDTGDFVIVVNADKIKFTGNKWDQKSYQTFSGYAGGQKIIPALEMLERKPTEILNLAVKRMLPRNRLGRQQLTKLKLYAGPSHPHQAQSPLELKID